jgi:hypothetical protein
MYGAPVAFSERQEGVMRIVVFAFAGVLAVLGAVTASGAQSGNLTSIVVCNEEAAQRAGNPSASPETREKPSTLTPEPGTRTDPSGSIVTEVRDPLLECMAARAKRDRR